MSNSNELERLWKVSAKVNMLVLDGKRSASVVADALQAILVEQSATIKPTFELYLFGNQKTGGVEKGHNIEAHLKKTGLITRCLSKDDECVKNWLTNPETYPEEFKGKAVFLWKSAEDRDGYREVPSLVWFEGKVVLRWHWLDDDWHGSLPAVLASALSLGLLV